MIRLIFRMIQIVMLMLMPAAVVFASSFTVLSYHDVRDNVNDGSTAMAISSATLVSHFAWLREHGYHIVSLDEILAAKEGRRPLPDKAVLLTFDDGYKSIYTRVYPLLRLFKYPAVIAVVGKWLDTPAGGKVLYGEEELARSAFLEWGQIREMVESGLVEVASHSYNLHRGIIANPQNNTLPAATTRLFNPNKKSYESDSAYTNRLFDDLSKSVEQIKRHTGRKPRAIVWPYGSYNQQGIAAARKLGMPITMDLSNGSNSVTDLTALNRLLILNNASLADIVYELRAPESPRPARIVHVDLDYIYDEDPGRQERNLGKLIDRIAALGVNTVYLQAFADPDGNGSADAVYFPNRHLPMRADLFSRVAWQLITRAKVRVYAWMPALAFELPDNHAAASLTVQDSGNVFSSVGIHYHRLSPFNPVVRKTISEIYEDLAKHANFNGLLFHDDVYLTDYEDASPQALQHYKGVWGLPGSVDEIRGSTELLNKWTELKTQYLIDWTKELEQRVRQYRPEIKTARNLYASVALNDHARYWFSQSLKAFLDHYDYTAVMAMPYMEKAQNPAQWLELLVKRIGDIPGALDRTVFELQSVDWNTGSKIGSKTLADQMDILRRNGATGYGYYPEDFSNNYPDIADIKPVISLDSDPYN